MKIITCLIAIIVLTVSCQKENYHMVFTGHLYKDCNKTPYVNEPISIRNTTRGIQADGATKTDENGYFKIELQGEGDPRFLVSTLDWQDEEVASANYEYYAVENNTLNLRVDSTLIIDTLFLILVPEGYKFGTNKFPPRYQVTPSHFLNGKASVSYNRRLYKGYYSYPERASYHLWLRNDMPLTMIWGVGRDQYNESIAQYKLNPNDENSRIMKISAKACDSSAWLQLY